MIINTDINWEQRRYEIAKEIYPVFLDAIFNNEHSPFGNYVKKRDKNSDRFGDMPAEFAMTYADILIEKIAQKTLEDIERHLTDEAKE